MCAFALRCTWAEDKCRTSRPPIVEAGPGRFTACVRIGEIEGDFRGSEAALDHAPAIQERSAAKDPILVVRDLAKSFAKGKVETKVLADVNIEVAPGESVGLVGESGSGKTTLARCVVGLERATAGVITIGGVDASDFAAMPAEKRQQVRRTVQMVFQNPYASLNPARTIGATLNEALSVAASAQDRPSVGDLLERVGLPSAYAGKKPVGLSGGERQRVAIARALAVSPRLLICDESVSALDVSVQAQILNLFGELQRDLNLGFLFITHDLGVVRQVTDRIYVLESGSIVEAGDTASVLDAPRHAYTQRLLESVPQPSPIDTGDDWQPLVRDPEKETKRMPKLEANGIEINYRLEGEGDQTIVLISGLADEIAMWDMQMPGLLAAGYQVLRFDNRGVGGTSKPAGPYSTATFAADTKALVDSLGLSDFHLVGVSMGGMIAQEYALRYGSDLRSLTLACTYAAPGPFCSRMYAMWADLAPVMGVPFVMRDVTLWGFTLPFFNERQAELAGFEEAMRFMDQPVHAYLAQLAAIQQHDARSRLSAISVPTLVLAGDDDILIPVSLSRELADDIPGATWATCPGGHMCVWEYSKEFTSAVTDFVGRH